MKKNNLIEAIREIIGKVPNGKIFDSHYVIDQLIKKHSDEYLVFAGSFDCLQNRTNTVHWQIALQTEKQSDLVVKEGETGDFWSENIHGTPSECTGWRRV